MLVEPVTSSKRVFLPYWKTFEGPFSSKSTYGHSSKQCLSDDHGLLSIWSNFQKVWTSGSNHCSQLFGTLTQPWRLASPFEKIWKNPKKPTKKNKKSKKKSKRYKKNPKNPKVHKNRPKPNKFQKWSKNPKIWKNLKNNFFLGGWIFFLQDKNAILLVFQY